MAFFALVLGVFSLSTSHTVSAAGIVTYSLVSFSCSSITVTATNNDNVNPNAFAAVAVNSGVGGAVGNANGGLLPSQSQTFTISFSPIVSGVINVAITDTSAGPGANYSYVCNLGSSGGLGISSAPCVNGDNRLNSVCDAPAQTVAVYCEKDGSVTVYAIYASKGYLAFIASPDEIAKVPSKPVKNTLIKQNLGARLYRLTSGELQVNRAEDSTGKDYVFIFKDCPKPQ
jgi:hypothetical protein